MKRSLPSSSWRCSAEETRDIIEQAKEELQILEAQQPDRFSYLKLELKSFISFLESQNLILTENKCPEMLAWPADSSFASISSSAATQASSTSKKRKKVETQFQETTGGGLEAPKQKFRSVDRTAAVVERARACLYKIQQFKAGIS